MSDATTEKEVLPLRDRLERFSSSEICRALRRVTGIERQPSAVRAWRRYGVPVLAIAPVSRALDWLEAQGEVKRG